MRVLCFFLVLVPIIPLRAGNALDPVFESYTVLQGALAGDDFAAAKKAAGALAKQVDKFDAGALKGELGKAWKAHGKKLGEAAGKTAGAGDIKVARTSFKELSDAIILLAVVAKPAGLGRFHCPMAFGNKGADWLQKEEVVGNPYYGAAMLRCGYKVGQQ